MKKSYNKIGIWSNLSYYPITKGSKNMNQINLGYSHNRCNEVKTIFKTWFKEKGYQNPNELKKAKKKGLGRIYSITLLQRGQNK